MNFDCEFDFQKNTFFIYFHMESCYSECCNGIVPESEFQLYTYCYIIFHNLMSSKLKHENINHDDHVI